MTKPPKRRRRTPEEAKQEILDVAEEIIISIGPAELKFQSIAERAGLAKSNVHHHFGGVLEIKRALTVRMIENLTSDLVVALSQPPGEDLTEYADQAMLKVYKILASERYAKLIGWIAVSTEMDAVEDFTRPLPLIVRVIEDKIRHFVPEADATSLAQSVVYQVAITAVGEGLLGPAMNIALGVSQPQNGALWVSAYWKQILQDILDKG